MIINGAEAVQAGDMVELAEPPRVFDWIYQRCMPGLVLRTQVNMWDEEPFGEETGVLVLWADGETEIVFDDELKTIQ